MKTPEILLMLAAVSLPLMARATPSIKIISPTKSPTTNGVLNATGTAASTVPITAVYYSFNGSGWAVAAGTTNWSAAGLELTPGSNTFSAYALDANSGVSKTNKVVFTYVVKVPVSVLTNGPGAVTPNYNGMLLQIGNTYKMTAKAAKGFGFNKWTGSAITNSPQLTFVMASNLAFTANFVDITRPVSVITYPAVAQHLNNATVAAAGRASDNVAVSNVLYSLNNGDWSTAAISGTNWTTALLALAPGATNTIQAFAVDTSGNISLTNTVKFVAGAFIGPVSLSGLTGTVTIDGDSGPFQINFGLSTFAQSSANGNEDSSVGTYTYTLMSSNMAQMTTAALLPPTDAGSLGGALFTFTNNTTATFTNGDGSNGVITFSAAASLVPSPSAIVTVQYAGLSGNTNMIVLDEGMFTNTDAFGDTNWGSYTFGTFGPQDAMLTEYFMDNALSGDVGYVQLDFSAAGGGSFSFNELDNLGKSLVNDAGSFAILSISNPPAGFAPASIVGEIVTVTPNGGSAFQQCFGSDTYSQSASDTNHFSGVGDYTFIKTGANTAQLFLIELEPPGNTNPILLHLTFSSTGATFAVTNGDGVHIGKFAFSAAKNYAPASVSGKTANVRFSNNTGTVVMKADRTFTNNDSNGTINSGFYTYAQYSPIGGMVILHINAGTDNGNTAYVGLTFSTTSSGSVFATSFDNLGNEVDAHGGTFTLR